MRTLTRATLRRLEREATADAEGALRDLLRLLTPPAREPVRGEGVWVEGHKAAGSLWHSAKGGRRVWVVVLQVDEGALGEALAPLGLRAEQWCEAPGDLWLGTTDVELVAHEGAVRVRVGEGVRSEWSRVRQWEAV